MATDNERTRAAAGVLLDIVSAFDETDPDDVSEAMIELSLRRLQDIGAFEATFDDETDVLTLSADPLLRGVLMMLTLLLGALSLAHNADRDAVISTVREQLLETLPD